jgi:exopolysaccharide biosynthesis polyprenyl glycosylphosphotransferase
MAAPVSESGRAIAHGAGVAGDVDAVQERAAAAPESLPRHLARDALRRRMLAGADSIAIVLAAVVAEIGSFSVANAFWTISLVPVWLVLAKLNGLYDRDHRTLRPLTVDELGSIVTWSILTTAGAMALLALVAADPPDTASALRMGLALTLLATAGRAVSRALWRRWTPPATALLVGSGPLERATRRKLELFGDIHTDIAGALQADDVATAAGDAELDERVSGACGGRFPDRVIVCTQDVHEELLTDTMRFCRRHRIKLSVVPPLRGMFGTAVRLTHVAELPVVEYHTWDTSQSTLTLKRCFDIAVASVGLLVTSPLLLLAAIAIRLDSRGSILYVQDRAGLDGHPFRMLKFRTMVADADDRRCDVVQLEALADPMYKLRADPRVTRVGRVLRRWSLDELPQLVNVLRGEMSLVGPRPEELALVERYRPEHHFRLQVVPGMTGPMQVFGRGDLDFDERLAIEREYLENLSLGRDLRILALTVPAVLSGRGAF